MMQPTATHCREQQAIQLALAVNEPLEARKKIAIVAAAAWAEEAKLADKRERRKAGLSVADQAIAQEFADEDMAIQSGKIQSRS